MPPQRSCHMRSPMVQEMRGAVGAAGMTRGGGVAAGDLQHQLGARRLAELVALADRDDEGAGAADHAILVIDVEILDIDRAAAAAA